MKKILLALGAFFLLSGSPAVAFFDDDFELYDVGSADGQGDWLNDQPASTSDATIKDTITKGVRSLNLGVGEYGDAIMRVGTSKSTGTISLWFNALSYPAVGYHDYSYLVFDGDSGTIQIAFTCIASESGCTSGKIIETNDNNLIGEFSFGEWYQLIMEYSGTTDKERFNFNNEGWSDWFDSFDVFGTMNEINFYTYGVRGGTPFLIFFDDIQDDPDLTELPEITLEDCPTSSSTQDRILCEIKNSFQGMFFPTTEKLNELKSVMSGFNQKFPFNYVSSTQDFLYNLRADLNDSEGIQIGLFNSTGTISFSGASSSAISYGSSSLTLLGYIKKFLTLLVILFMAGWLINYAKRVFK